MSKYIDAEKLIAEITRLYKQNTCDFDNGCNEDQCYGYGIALSDLQIIIDSLQQEQSESLKGKFVFPNFLYARTVDNKTIDVSYAPQSMDAVEYINSDSLQQEQPDENLDEAARDYGVRGNAYGVGGEDYADDLAIAFKAGAQWMKDQLTVK